MITRDENLPASNAAVIFDRDGTLIVDRGFTYRPEDLSFTPGAPEAIAALNAANVRALVATNQSGVARGLFDEKAVQKFHDHMQAQLAKRGAHIDQFYYCPFHPDGVDLRYRAADHPDRKPNPGMLLRAISDWRIDRRRALMIGDKSQDMEAARAADLPGVVYEGGNLATLVEAFLSRLGAL